MITNLLTISLKHQVSMLVVIVGTLVVDQAVIICEIIGFILMRIGEAARETIGITATIIAEVIQVIKKETMNREAEQVVGIVGQEEIIFILEIEPII